jgi:hypothetical protein
MADSVTFGADASEYFSVVARMQEKLDELSATHGGFNRAIGDQRGFDGFLQGEYRVSHQAKFLVASLLEAKDAASGAANALQAAVFSTRVPLAAAVGGIVLAEGIKLTSAAIHEVEVATSTLKKELGSPIALQVDLAPADITLRIEAITKAVDDLAKKRDSIGARVGQIIMGAAPGFSGARNVVEETLIAGREKERRLADALADAELRVTDIKREGLHVSEEESAVDKANLAYENARAKLFENAFKPGAQQNDIFKRLAALTQEKDLTIETAREKGILEGLSNEHATDLANIEKSGLATQDETLAKLRLEVRYRQQIANEALKVGQVEGIDKANAGLAEAQAALIKFQRARAFNDTQELNAAKAATAELDAQAHGQKFLADLIEIRATAEAKITAALREQKGELAKQEALQAKIALDQAVGKQALRTPEQINQDAAAAQLAQFISTVGAQLIAMLRQDVAHGAKLDPIQQKILDADNAIKDTMKDPKAPKDPPELAELKTLNRTAREILFRLGGKPDSANSVDKGSTKPGDTDPRQTNTTLTPPHDWSAFDKFFHGDPGPFGSLGGTPPHDWSSFDNFFHPNPNTGNPPSGQGEDAGGGGKSGLDSLSGLDFSSLESLSGDDFSGIESLSGADFSGIESLSSADFSSLVELGSADFSSLNELAGMDFSGLESLNGLTISIQ